MKPDGLDIGRLWGHDADRVWGVIRWLVAPTLTMALAPGSRAYGVDRVPLEGGFVLAANHLSALDHPLIGIFCPRTIHFMAKAELIAMPVVGDLLSWTGAFPVRRGESDREALRESRRLVRDGHVVGVHVEGTRQRFGYPGEVKIGGMMIAMQEGVPVVPCAVETFGWSLRNRRACAAVFGSPIPLADRSRDRAGYDDLMETVSAELIRLWRQAAGAVAAGLPPQLPDGAKRYPPFLRGLTTDGARPVPE